MKIFVKLVKNEKGITLMELLATFVVMTIVMTVIYSVFANGIGVAKKIGIEGQLRDDADYVVTMIMNELNSGEFDEVKNCDGKVNCIELIDNQALQLEEYSNDGESFYDVEKKQKDNADEIKTIQIELVKENHFEIDGKKIDAQGNFAGSKLSSTCSQGPCSDGIINMKLVINDASLNKPLILESKFGF